MSFSTDSIPKRTFKSFEEMNEALAERDELKQHLENGTVFVTVEEAFQNES